MGGSETAGALVRRHFESLAASMQKGGASPLLLICTFAAEAPALPSALAQQIADGLRVWSNKVAALIARAQAEGQISVEADPDLLAALLINCRQGVTIRVKCDPSAPCDYLWFALDRVLSVSRSET